MLSASSKDGPGLAPLHAPAGGLPPVRPPRERRLVPESWPSLAAPATSAVHAPIVRVASGPVPQWGCGLVACQDLSDGELVLEEEPLVQAEVCSPDERKSDAKAARLIGKLAANSVELFCDCDLMVKQVKALVGLNVDAKAKVLAMGTDHDPLLPGGHPLVKLLRQVADIASKTLEVSGMWSATELERGLQVLAVYGTKHELLYKLASCANHACAPNARWAILEGGKLQVHAVGQIAAGEELTLSYFPGSVLLHWQARQRFLYDKRGFTCHCAMCKEEQTAEEADCASAAHSEPDAEPSGEPEDRSEPEAEHARVPQKARGPRFALPQSHLRCVQCRPQQEPDGWLLDQATYVQWLSDARSIPTMRRTGASPAERRVVTHATWQCGTCGSRLDLSDQCKGASQEQMRKMAEMEMQLTYRALDHYSEHDPAKLMELWPLCERILGPWHGVTLFSALHALPLLNEERAYKVRARLAVAGVDDALVQECAW